MRLSNKYIAAVGLRPDVYSVIADQSLRRAEGRIRCRGSVVTDGFTVVLIPRCLEITLVYSDLYEDFCEFYHSHSADAVHFAAMRIVISAVDVTLRICGSIVDSIERRVQGLS